MREEAVGGPTDLLIYHHKCPIDILKVDGYQLGIVVLFDGILEVPLHRLVHIVQDALEIASLYCGRIHSKKKQDLLQLGLRSIANAIKT